VNHKIAPLPHLIDPWSAISPTLNITDIDANKFRQRLMQSLLLAGNTLKLAVLFDNPLETRTGAQQGGAFGAFAPTPEIFKTLHSNFDICRNFQRIKMKFYILINFKKSY